MRKFEKIRQEIKKLSEDQKVFKPLRKPSNAYSSEKMAGLTPYGAFSLVLKNKYELRHLFQAYAILKGVGRQPVTKKYISDAKVQSLVELYKEVE